LRENIVNKTVDRTDEFIAKAIHEEEIKQLKGPTSIDRFSTPFSRRRNKL
jgi:hypothetical protein